MEPEELYRHLGRLIETAPQDFKQSGEFTSEQMRWLGRARALIKEGDDLSILANYDHHARNLRTALRTDSLQSIMAVLYVALAAAEIKAPASAQGAFIPAGNRFDAFAAITKVMQSAETDLLIVDPYLDETILTEFGGSIPAIITLRLLTDQASAKPSIAPAAKAWAAQHGTARPIALRLAAPNALHDRMILVDKTTAWTVTQSFKDFATRAPAEIVRADDTAALKISAYEAIWANASVAV